MLYSHDPEGERFVPREGDTVAFLGSRVEGRTCPSGEKWRRRFRSLKGGALTWPRLQSEPP